MTRKPSATPGLLLVIAGVIALAMGTPPFSFGWTPLLMGGAFVLGGGTLLARRHFHREVVVRGLVPAHEAFRRRETVRAPPVEDPLEGIRVPDAIPEVGEVEALSVEDLHLHSLDVRIRELEEKLNKATVLLGTHRLSREGYKRYVEDLRNEKSDLEAERLHIQMRQGRIDGKVHRSREI